VGGFGALGGRQTMATIKKHVPAPGSCGDNSGPALCGRWGRYATGDHNLIRRLAGEGGAHWCQRCVALVQAEEAELQADYRQIMGR